MRTRNIAIDDVTIDQKILFESDKKSRICVNDFFKSITFEFC